ncbi:hypothetical protein PORY_002801 [Pneumocystis oryctolagi]|uniref:Uncharacterized protein n=1 Tax=Pneumocystis oryctolagi TaxID=42067 RepID=A0ACB7CA88_9ASCO|nr:hypothetical protein PORY_002801 [Pneumocystis oryctolagi]
MELIDLLILIISFLGYKTIFIFICVLSSFLNVYDTSALLLLRKPKNLFQKIIVSFVRWDNIYFIALAHRGLLFEQEWAFGPGFPYIVRLFTDWIFVSKSLYNYAFISILLSHLFHLCSIFSLYYLTFKIYQSRDMAIVTSFLYLISPSGIFLSAGYTETALSWCIASIIRSNGLLLSVFFLYPTFMYIYQILRYPEFGLCLKMIKFGIYSLIVCAGFFWVQYCAYIEFCWPEKKRDWCFKKIPFIYSFVQSYYWNVGFFKYFKVSQIPNFALAFPAILISIKSGIHYFLKNNKFRKITRNLDLYYITQLLLTVVCICVMHVQIFTRMISCLPGIYWWLADCLLNDRLYSCSNKFSLKKKKSLYWVKIWILYGTVQAVLFGTFLPPA